MSGILKGKDIVDSSITEVKLDTALKAKLIQHSIVTNQDLTSGSQSASLTFDGITGTVVYDGDTFITMTFTSDTVITGVNLVRTVYAGGGNSTQRLDNQTIDSTGVSFTPLTAGANPKIEVEIVTPGAIYEITAGGSLDLTNCWGYVEKIL